ncbi:CubicO group peptidase (beta-lactamase class C family) [Motilibacter rhizosphaerae]|uniref:CubicO group peptidase (Beta-lactamase class C family) n=1 Tax=Motilibacter rhizosphaerae TaxID=598652 RepID=A0A4Q7NPG7_9ACTN|nr:serine hydrolase domain-containing protein [Motilibacter rhizosphaerae]RZS87194.1 CubicO group peptidase (beta-lactamase class C family) [Motilibacter rhizosphaerae]
MRPDLEAQLLARAARSQAEGRLPSLAAGVVQDGSLSWWCGRGCIDGTPSGSEPDADTQYRIGSITKTFVAVLVMRLREEGRLELDDPLETHVPGTPFGDRSLGQLLAHAGGLTAESPGDWWERTPGVPFDELAQRLTTEHEKLATGTRFHYSNLGFGLLGRVVEVVRGRPWLDCAREEVLEPLGMVRTTPRPEAPAAQGFAVHPWADVVLPEPEEDAVAMGPAGQLWSTLTDLAKYAGVFLGRAPQVLSPETVREMSVPGVVDARPSGWSAYGLGLQVHQRPDGRRLTGHGGSMPGFLASFLVDAEQQTASIVMANATSGLDGTIGADLLDLLKEREPYVVPAWRAVPEQPGDLEIAGPWYWGVTPLAVRLRGLDALDLVPLGPAGRGARFVRVDGAWVGLDGYYAGETLRVVRTPEGAVSHLDLATFVLTREPYEPAAVQPGGVEAPGWRPLC